MREWNKVIVIIMLFIILSAYNINNEDQINQKYYINMQTLFEYNINNIYKVKLIIPLFEIYKVFLYKALFPNNIYILPKFLDENIFQYINQNDIINFIYEYNLSSKIKKTINIMEDDNPANFYTETNLLFIPEIYKEAPKYLPEIPISTFYIFYNRYEGNFKKILNDIKGYILNIFYNKKLELDKVINRIYLTLDLKVNSNIIIKPNYITSNKFIKIDYFNMSCYLNFNRNCYNDILSFFGIFKLNQNSNLLEIFSKYEGNYIVFNPFFYCLENEKYLDIYSILSHEYFHLFQDNYVNKIFYNNLKNYYLNNKNLNELLDKIIIKDNLSINESTTIFDYFYYNSSKILSFSEISAIIYQHWFIQKFYNNEYYLELKLYNLAIAYFKLIKDFIIKYDEMYNLEIWYNIFYNFYNYYFLNLI